MSEISLEIIYKEVKDLRMLIESLAETIDVLSNPKELKGIYKGLMNIKKGRIRSWNEFEQESKKKVNFNQMPYEIEVTKHFEGLLSN